MNKISFNNLYITVKKNKTLTIDKQKIINFSGFLKNIEINKTNILDNSYYWLEKITCNDIVIIDPPYDSFNNAYTNYSTMFNKSCHEKLYFFIKDLVNKGVQLISFNNDTPFIRNLYNNFNIDIIKRYCQMTHKNKTELFIYN